MKNKIFLIVMLLTAVVLACKNSSLTTSNLPQLGKNSMDEVIQVLTLEEKVNLVIRAQFYARHQGQGNIYIARNNSRM